MRKKRKKVMMRKISEEDSDDSDGYYGCKKLPKKRAPLKKY